MIVWGSPCDEAPQDEATVRLCHRALDHRWISKMCHTLSLTHIASMFPSDKEFIGYSFKACLGSMQKSRGVVLILATLLLSASKIVAYNSGAYKRDCAALADFPNRMQRRFDATLVIETSLASIHDTMTLCNRGTDHRDGCKGVPILQYSSQSTTLQQQLDSGIRYVDIHTAYKKEAAIDVSPFIQLIDCDEDETDCTYQLYRPPANLGYGLGPGTCPTYNDIVERTVIDEEGGVGSNSATVTVNKVDPTASIDSMTDELGNQIGVGLKCASFVLVGLPLTGTFSFADTGLLDTHSAAVDWKDDSAVSFYDFPAITPFSEVHTYATSGVFDVSLTVTNDDAGTVAVSESIEVLESTEAVSRILEALRDLVVVTEEEQELFQNTTGALEGNVKDGSTSASGALNMLLQENLDAAFMKIGEALTFMGRLDDLLEDDDLTPCKSILVLTVKSVVMDLFENFDGQPYFQTRAEDKIGEGDEAALGGSYEEAVIRYTEALHSLAIA
jgi:hypothetical protein